MDIVLIYEGKATVEDILTLTGLGYKFNISDGYISEVICDD